MRFIKKEDVRVGDEIIFPANGIVLVTDRLKAELSRPDTLISAVILVHHPQPKGMLHHYATRAARELYERFNTGNCREKEFTELAQKTRDLLDDYLMGLPNPPKPA